ncbi:MAG: hypothetical protein MK299_12735, partial [Pseudomonadales bacterium]|nr:hypothetical protein [Pseudomonadales bacterium]
RCRELFLLVILDLPQFNLITLDFHQPDLFLHHSINKLTPKKLEGHSSLDHLRVTLFALKQIVSHLDTVSRKLNLSP